ncbi:ketohydroxyglutarate aldolase [Sphingomonas sp. 7/4-4]|uniref:ketohydroxyglutarate aldolase n=1 Tax=Sphingomonas sp. 7/4-4 TaxID=3018446 RepID=UPI0022F3F54F|nr:ketohydroxyglutarate aldolase [Sphingomonas sp. 7/4-4]WBY07157.1 ketohydroxyglutarate aldolase [Sphingomonas sp. 7/4-4]
MHGAAQAAPRRGPDRRSWRYRGNVAARTLAGTIGAYAIAALFGAALARTLPLERLDATVVATLLAFLVAPAVTVWAYLARGPGRAVVGVIGLAALLAAIVWYAGPPA